MVLSMAWGNKSNACMHSIPCTNSIPVLAALAFAAVEADRKDSPRNKVLKTNMHASNVNIKVAY